MARLLTVLGKTRYQSASYDLTMVPDRFYETRYASVATAALAGFMTDASVLLTTEAREENWDGCQAAFAGIGMRARPVDIPLGCTEDEIWQIFMAITGSLVCARAGWIPQ